MDRKPLRLWIGVLGGVLAVFLIGVVLVRDMRNPGPRVSRVPGFPIGSGDEVGVVKLEGVLLDDEEFLKGLKEFEDDDRVKAIVVAINSPGGAVAPSQAMYDAVLRIRRGGEKPIYASMGTVAASGGLYVAAAAERIYAAPGTLTGSIGVIIQSANLSRLFEKIGYEPTVIKSGKYKDILSTSRGLTDEERVLVQGVVDNVRAQFVGAIAEGRGLDAKEIDKIADGRFFTGSMAKDYGIVDELGYLSDAVDAAAKAAGIEGEPSVVYPRPPRRSLGEWFVGGLAHSFARALANESTLTLRFLP